MCLLQISGLPESATPRFALQLSSPVEEAILSKVYAEDAEDTSEMVATFQSVETNQATLTRISNPNTHKLFR
jgi:hypothetical protein